MEYDAETTKKRVIDEFIRSIESIDGHPKCPEASKKSYYLKACWLLYSFNRAKSIINFSSETTKANFEDNRLFIQNAISLLRQ